MVAMSDVVRGLPGAPDGARGLSADGIARIEADQGVSLPADDRELRRLRDR